VPREVIDRFFENSALSSPRPSGASRGAPKGRENKTAKITHEKKELSGSVSPDRCPPSPFCPEGFGGTGANRAGGVAPEGSRGEPSPRNQPYRGECLTYCPRSGHGATKERARRSRVWGPRGAKPPDGEGTGEPKNEKVQAPPLFYVGSSYSEVRRVRKKNSAGLLTYKHI